MAVLDNVDAEFLVYRLCKIKVRLLMTMIEQIVRRNSISREAQMDRISTNTTFKRTSVL